MAEQKTIEQRVKEIIVNQLNVNESRSPRRLRSSTISAQIPSTPSS
jgi:acyl carrier protein